MSMLAGPRRKQKVINLRAKNNAWSNDNSKFGQRMLEKMGWSSGKGLGAKEDGIVEHVVARYKNDEKGLGFEDRNDQWTKHEDDFNALLANLSNANSDEEVMHSGVSLEVKSKKSKTRIHYHKFTRGKDLSRYSEKDLANIFGKKSLKGKEKEVAEEILEDVKTSDKLFTEKGSMVDYFKKKLSKKLGKEFSLTEVTEKETETQNQGFGYQSDTENSYRGFGFPMDVDNGSADETSYRGFGFEAAPCETASDTHNLIHEEDDIVIKDKKQKKVRFVDKNEEYNTNNGCTVSIEINSVTLEKITKKKNKVYEISPIENANGEIENGVSEVKQSQKKKKKTKKKDDHLKNTNKSDNSQEEDSNARSDVKNDTTESKKGKKKKSKQLTPRDTEDIAPKKKKKKNR